MGLSSRLAENLRKRRGNLSQVAFARKLGISQATLNRIENVRQNVTLATLEQFTKVLKCDIEDLFKD